MGEVQANWICVQRVDSGYRSGMSVQSSLVMGGIDEFGTKEQKERFLPGMAKGTILGAFGLTERTNYDPGVYNSTNVAWQQTTGPILGRKYPPGNALLAGAPAKPRSCDRMETIARLHPAKKGVYVLSGSKTWITNSPIADVLMVWARLDGKIRGFLIERSSAAPGALSTPVIKNKNGLRASITGMILLDDVEVPEENVLPDITGLKGPFSCLNNARYGIAWGTMGALEDCIRRTRVYALERKQFGKPLAKYQLVQQKLADATTDAAFGLTVSLHVGRLKDKGLCTPEMISMIKRQNCDRALFNARR